MSTRGTATSVILHLGLGSFHRAHQAAYVQELIDSGDESWVLAGGNTRPDMAEVIAALRAQGGAYVVEIVTPAGVRSYRKINAIKAIVPYERGLAGLVEIGAGPATRIVSFTVTEAGYYLDAENRLDTSFDEIASDIAAAGQGYAGGTIYAAIAEILRARRRCGAGPVTLLNCDNLRQNGERFRAGLLQFVDLVGDTDLGRWIEDHTTSPNAMVDRITPRPAPDLRERVAAATGWDDRAPVMAESFTQWVIEDDFCNGRPAWERVGVEMVESVAPYEEAKIRILNASHSCIAWAGTLLGLQFIHEGVRDARIRRFAHDYITDDVIPCLQPSPIDLPRYRDVVLDRFANAALCDTNQRVAMDGFSKIPGFIVPTVRERLDAGASIAGVAMLPALFLAFLQRWHREELRTPYQDQAMDPAVAHAICDSLDPVQAFCSLTTLWDRLAGDARLYSAIRDATGRVRDFLRGGGR